VASAARPALIVVPELRSAGAGGHARPLAARIDEALGLAYAIDLDVVATAPVSMPAFRPATLIGAGKVEELGEAVRAHQVEVVIVDHPLTPVQQRNLERAWNTKVIDRTGLILEIFGDRAETSEGRLQVELAHLNYQKSRLVRSWTHLERQRGGYGFLGGPGETQIEADRRAIQTRIERIERDLDKTVQMRRLQRRGRRRSHQPVIALVGYTNAGKSTLFNRLTEAGRPAEDKLFATLDPTLRQIDLPSGATAILSDTVGFVSDLPTDLVAAFRATLEEVIEADLILHVRDFSHADSEIQARDVEQVLRQLGIDPDQPGRIIEVWNKIDLMPVERLPVADALSLARGTAVPISALTGEGIDRLLGAIEARLSSASTTYRMSLSGPQLARLHEVYAAGQVLERTDRADGTTDLLVRAPAQFRRNLLQIDPDATPEMPGHAGS
jgi:GTP-binding protein HflX